MFDMFQEIVRAQSDIENVARPGLACSTLLWYYLSMNR